MGHFDVKWHGCASCEATASTSSSCFFAGLAFSLSRHPSVPGVPEGRRGAAVVCAKSYINSTETACGESVAVISNASGPQTTDSHHRVAIAPRVELRNSSTAPLDEPLNNHTLDSQISHVQHITYNKHGSSSIINDRCHRLFHRDFHPSCEPRPLHHLAPDTRVANMSCSWPSSSSAGAVPISSSTSA